MIERIKDLFIGPTPPLTPMIFTRVPIMPRFWGGGAAALAVGIAIGLLLWGWREGHPPPFTTDYVFWLEWHPRLLLILFVGSFVLGFALQAGPHVVGGAPPDSRLVLTLAPTLWAGVALGTIPLPGMATLGNLLIAASFAMGAWLLAKMTWQGDPTRRLGIGLPLAGGVATMAALPYSPLTDPSVVTALLWSGPVTVILAAGQQLLANVMGGRRLLAPLALPFLALLTLAWGSALAAASGSLDWRLAILPWLALLLYYLIATRSLTAIVQSGFSSLSLAIGGGLFSALASGVWVALDGPQDGTVHLLAAGCVTTLILAVAARVVSFFSAGYLLPDRALAWLLTAWLLVAWMRALTPHSGMVPGVIALAVVILLLWVTRFFLRLRGIRDHLPVSLGGLKKE